MKSRLQRIALTGRWCDGKGAIRVMVNCNQTGEAAGVACALALQDGLDVASVDPNELREALAWGGSLIL